LKPDFAGVYLNLAKMYFQLGNMEEAARNYYLAGQIKSVQNPCQESINCYKTAIQIDPGKAEYHLALGDAFRVHQQWDEAAQAYEDSIQVNPSQAEVYYKLGIALSRSPEPKVKQAISSYERAIKLNPNDYQYFHHLGDALLSLKNYSESIKAYEKSIKLNPKSLWSYNNMGLALNKAKKIEESIEYYRKAIYLDQSQSRIHYDLGLSLQKLARLDEAVEAYQKVIALEPQHHLALHKLGDIFLEKSDLDLAVSYHKCAIEISPSTFQYYHSLGATLAKQGKLADAIEAYYRVLEINPQLGAAYIDLIDLMTQQERWIEARTLCIKGLYVAPGNLVIYRQFGHVLKMSGKPDESQECYHAIFPKSILNELGFNTSEVIHFSTRDSAENVAHIELSSDCKIELLPPRSLDGQSHQDIPLSYNLPRDFVVVLDYGRGYGGDGLNSAIINSKGKLLKYASTGNSEFAFCLKSQDLFCKFMGQLLFYQQSILPATTFTG
ncbi:MAG: tetratricopeptide repeat protein, partial [Synechococcaceae cyanobacterium SM2_3_1]|nr:tetratricopeptide repeat protein [Synechococcaceae cyanobacterium SM2_3_1]